MKKFLAVLALAPVAALAGNHPMAGCGLIYTAGLKENKPFPQIVSSLFNNFYGTQTFGITSGTSGCTEEGLVALSVETEVYAEANFKEIQRDVAAGGGEYLVGLADLLGVHPENRRDFSSYLQTRYTALFPTTEMTSLDLVNALRRELARRPDLFA